MSDPMDESTDHAAEATARIGKRLAHLRATRGLKISDLARRIGVSPSLISQVERGQSRPSVTTLFALAQQLGVTVDTFFESQPGEDPETGAQPRSGSAAEVLPPAPLNGDVFSNSLMRTPARGSEASQSDRYVLRREERPVLEIQGGVTWERLTRSPLQDIDFMELVYQPGAESNRQLYRHPGIELVLVTASRFEITVGFEVNQVSAGDSIAFPSTLPHRYRNPTDQVSRAITVIIHDGLAALPGLGTTVDINAALLNQTSEPHDAGAGG